MVTVTSPYKKSAVRKFCTITNIVKAFTSSSLDAIINKGCVIGSIIKWSTSSDIVNI